MLRPLFPRLLSDDEFVGLNPRDERFALPKASPGRRVGLFGGTFDPPHEGHQNAAKMALNRLQLDELWWMVTPGNPLKRGQPLSDLKRRLDATEAWAQDPRIRITAFEARFAVHTTCDVIQFLRSRYPGVRFVWIMGGDNLMSFHRWENWTSIMRSVPIAVIDRPGAPSPALRSPAARHFWKHRLDQDDAGLLVEKPPPAWCVLHGPLKSVSSTRLRAEGRGLS